jgi:quercetin dioxygenase-like cupin family protein
MFETIVRQRDEGQATWFLNGLMLTKASVAETGGAYCMMEHRMTAASNPPPHIHNNEEEAFYVLEGEMEVEVGGEAATLTAGGFALAPRGVPHSFRVLSDEVRVLVIASSPGGNTNGGTPHFFETVGQPASMLTIPVPQAPDPVVLTAVAAEHDIAILSPPGL